MTRPLNQVSMLQTLRTGDRIKMIKNDQMLDQGLIEVTGTISDVYEDTFVLYVNELRQVITVNFCDGLILRNN